jgi:alkanesulfonate monooxygenase
VIVQAGASDAGRQLAAETAEVIFGSESTLDAGKRFYADVKGRMRAIGRHPDHLKILPAAFVVVGDTVAEAQAKRAHLDSLVHYDSGIRSLSIMLGYDVSGFDPDGQLPEIPESNASKSSRERMVAAARDKHLTIRQLAAKAGSYAGLAFVGTAETIADGMETWLEEQGSDGFNIMFRSCPPGSTSSPRGSFPSCSGAVFFVRNTPAQHCANTSACPGPRIAFSKFPRSKPRPEHSFDEE